MSDQEEKSDIHERFGRYLILDHLVDGGMAKICRARFLGEQADKIVAIKMVQPQFSQDDSFKTMFMDEIKMTFGLIHPNVVQTYDYGIQKDQLFVAMEYCDGRNLKEYLDKLKERKFVFPVEISVYIVTQACQGLHYAHTFTDKLTGKEANIIHRDISPHNIMLTYDGAVKIIDFGIAKSETNSEATQAGTIKGKLSYLAPEYLEGHALDPRYDQFAIGITLWEMLCSRKLFKASNDLAVLKKIQECKVPAPSSINPNVPKELDEIVLKALSKDRNKRYENMEQLNRALIKFLYTNYPDFNATDLSYFAKELFKKEIKKDRERLFEFGKINLRPYLNDLRRELEGGTVQEGNSGTSQQDQTQKKPKEQVLDFGFEGEEEAADSKIRVSQMRSKTGTSKAKKTKKDAPTEVRAKEASSAGQDLSLGAGSNDSSPQTRTSVKRSSGTKSQSGTSIRMKKDGKTRTRQVRMKKGTKKSSSFKRIFAAGVALLLVGGYLYLPSQKDDQNRDPASNFSDEKDVSSDLSEQGQSKEMGSFRLSNFDKFRQRVFVNGEEKKTDIIGMVKAPINEEITIRVQQSGRRHFIKKMILKGNNDPVVEVSRMPPVSYGYLETKRTCTRGKIYFEVFGEKRVQDLPIGANSRIAFPVSRSGNGSSHEVYYQKEGEDIQRKITLNFQDGKTTDFCEYID